MQKPSPEATRRPTGRPYPGWMLPILEMVERQAECEHDWIRTGHGAETWRCRKCSQEVEGIARG